MSLTIDWLHLVILLGAVQGLFLAAVLAARQRNQTANRWLAALMLAFTVHLASTVYHAAGLVPAAPHLFGIAYPMPFLYGPLVYLYALAAADRTRGVRRADALHFAPFLATVLAGLPIYMMSAAGKVALFNQFEARTGEPPLLIVIADPLKFVSGITYAVLTIVVLRRHRERVKDSYSTTERVSLHWLLWFANAAAGVWALAVAVDVLRAAGVMRFDGGDDIVSLAIAVLVYGVGYRALRQPEIFRYETSEFAVPVPAPAAAPAPASPQAPSTQRVAEPEPEPVRYERSGLSEAGAQRLKARLLEAMDAKRPWADADLTLPDLAALLNTTPHKLSEVLNSQIGQTFYDFVNSYRVREVQRRIAAGDARKLKMLALALDAGFASKSTFNQVFKKHTSQTPSAYQQALGA